MSLLVFSCVFSGCSDRISTDRNIRITRHGSLIGLKKEFEERYIILHKHTFPGVLDRIRKCNIRNYSIFLKDGILFSHFEYVGSEFETDMAQMEDEVTKEWWKLTDPMQEPLENRKQGEWWASMDLIYQMDTSIVDYTDVQRFALVGYLKKDQVKNYRQRLNRIDDSLVALFLEAHFQNVTFYSWSDRIYFYYEYGGTDYEQDKDSLSDSEEWQQLNSDLKALMQPVSEKNVDRIWHEMNEVFHTN
jgi:L-rhamnose mutarotase